MTDFVQSSIWKSKLKSAAIIAVVALFVSVVASAVIGSVLLIRIYVLTKPGQPESKHQAVERQLDEIASPPSATQIRQTGHSDAKQRTINSYYQTSLTYNDLRKHYDFELAQRGWKFQEEFRVTQGGDPGELKRVYCRESLSANLYFTGSREQELGYGYSFGLSWGPVSCN